MLKSHIVLGYDAQGNKIRKVIRAETKEDLAVKKYLARKAFQEQTLPSNLRFSQYAKTWLATYKSTSTKNTLAMYRNVLAKCDAAIGGKKLTTITQTDLQLIIAKNGDSPNTCAKIRLTLRQIFRAAERDGLIQRNPAEGLTVPTYRPTEQRPLTDAERGAVARAELDPMDRSYLDALYYFGLRPGEALALMPGDFDFSARTLTVRRSVSFPVNQPELKGTKTNNVRKIPIPLEALGKFKSYCSTCGLYLFHREDGSLMSKSSQRRMWDRIIREINRQLGGSASIDLTNGLHPYIFRHDFATTLYYSGVSLKKAAELLGHADTKMIMQVYAHVEDENEDLTGVVARSLKKVL